MNSYENCAIGVEASIQGQIMTENKIFREKRVFSVVFVLVIGLTFLDSYYQTGSLKVVSIVAVFLACWKIARGMGSDKLRKQLLIFILPIIFLMLVTVLLFVFSGNKSGLASLLYGEKKLLYQLISILVACAAVLLFGKRAVVLTVYGICLAGVTILLISLSKYGVSASARACLDLINTYFTGNPSVHDFTASMEMHDFTFSLGMILIYLLFYRKIGIRCYAVWILLLSVLFLLGYCRIAFLAVFAGIIFEILGILFKRKTEKFKIFGIYAALVLLGICCIIFLWIIYNGELKTIFQNTDMTINGREMWFAEIEKVPFDIGYVGSGIGYTWNLFGMEIHNDILRQYIDLGGVVFLFWLFVQLVLIPFCLKRWISFKSLKIYCTFTIFLFVTYFTDNSMFYFNSMYVYYMLCMQGCVDSDNENGEIIC